MSGRTWGGLALLAVAAFMLFGFLRSAVSIGSPAAITALLLTVALPAVAGIALIRGIATISGRRSARVDELRRRTIEAEIPRLAIQHGGRLTAMEVATALALPSETAKETLDAMAE